MGFVALPEGRRRHQIPDEFRAAGFNLKTQLRDVGFAFSAEGSR
jgi:hypothetical protein